MVVRYLSVYHEFNVELQRNIPYTLFMELLQTYSAIVIIVLIFWVLPWKGYALWLAARNTHKWWFIILLLVNTLAILDIIYIFAVGRKATEKTGGDDAVM